MKTSTHTHFSSYFPHFPHYHAKNPKSKKISFAHPHSPPQKRKTSPPSMEHEMPSITIDSEDKRVKLDGGVIRRAIHSKLSLQLAGGPGCFRNAESVSNCETAEWKSTTRSSRLIPSKSNEKRLYIQIKRNAKGITSPNHSQV